ncbi:MAG: methyltransferase domain-containing protein [Acidobacteria bacterium]|nr:methyltransferase domain-containing protein [Acidobacteriota bacterium]
MNAELQIGSDGAKSQSAWTEHWADERQQSISQRFFSFYRKAVFARTVSYFTSRYFPTQGVFVEAGSGTAETSIRIDKCGGARKLIATDIVQPVLKRCHPVMDSRVCGDIFNMPYADDSVDGIWNVGVMEHFTHEQIDMIMTEFHRILKPGHRIILLWPGADSLPQKMLRFVEFIVNSRGKKEKFSFHPPEISQLKSRKEGHEVLRRNGFRSTHIEYGWRSLMAFKTLVAVKDEN